MSPLMRRSSTSVRRRRRVHPLVIAAVTILATVAVTFYAFNQGLPFVHRFTLYTVVNNSVNVRSGSPVRVAGIDVGMVQGVSPAGDATRIAFTVNSNGQPIHRDATIRIRPRLFLEGSYYLDLAPGSPSAPIFNDGDTIPESQTSTPVQAFQVLSTFDMTARASLENLLNTLNEGFSPQPGHPLSDSGAGGFKSAIPQLVPVLKDVAWIAQALQGTQPGDVERLLSSASDVTRTLAANSAQLVDLVTSLNRTAGALASSDGALAQSISGIDQTLQVAPPALSAVDHALPPLVALGQALDPSLKLAPPILDSLTGTVRELAAIVAPIPRGQLLTSLKATFQELPSLLTELATAFPITKQVTDCLRTNVLPILKATVPDGPLSTGRPVWQDFVHFLPGVGGASGGFDANGPHTRVLAGAGPESLAGGELGTLPGLGQVVGTPPPGGSSLSGARPVWFGSLTSADFRPDVACATQAVPSLASPTAAPDLQSTRSPAPRALSTRQLRAVVVRATQGVPTR